MELKQSKAPVMGLSCQDLITFPDRPTAAKQPRLRCFLPIKELVQRLGLILRQVFPEECRLVWVQAKRLSDLGNGQCLLVEKFAVGDWG